MHNMNGVKSQARILNFMNDVDSTQKKCNSSLKVLRLWLHFYTKYKHMHTHSYTCTATKFSRHMKKNRIFFSLTNIFCGWFLPFMWSRFLIFFVLSLSLFRSSFKWSTTSICCVICNCTLTKIDLCKIEWIFLFTYIFLSLLECNMKLFLLLFRSRINEKFRGYFGSCVL